MNNRPYIALVVCMILGCVCSAQHTVRGVVLDKYDHDYRIPGVNVVVKGTMISTITDFDGNFELEVPDRNVTIVFSFIGMISKEISLEEREYLEVKMKPDCYVHFYDQRLLDLFFLGGTLESTWGGQVNVALPTDLVIKNQHWTLHNGTVLSDQSRSDRFSKRSSRVPALRL